MKLIIKGSEVFAPVSYFISFHLFAKKSENEKVSDFAIVFVVLIFNSNILFNKRRTRFLVSEFLFAISKRVSYLKFLRLFSIFWRIDFIRPSN